MSLLRTHQNTWHVLLFVYLSFVDMLPCIGFLHLMLSFEIVLWCRWKATKCFSYKNALMRWHDRLVFQTFWCELVVFAIIFFIYFFDPLNDQNDFWCLYESYREWYPWHSSTGLMSFGPLQHKQSSKHCSCVISCRQNDIFILIINLLQDTSHISSQLLYEGCRYSISFPQTLRSSQINFYS